MTRNLLRAGALSCALLTSTALASPALAQSLPAYRSVDANGVDLTRGDSILTFTDAVIGSGRGALSLTRVGGNHYGPYEWDRMLLRRTGSQVTIESSQRAEIFNGTSGTIASSLGNGSTLTQTADDEYKLTQADGTVIVFGPPLLLGGTSNTYCSYALDPSQECLLLPQSITSPDGGRIELMWEAGSMGSSTLDPMAPSDHAHRLWQVSNSYGYRVIFSYVGNSEPHGDWFLKAGAELRNEHAEQPEIGTIGYASPSDTVSEVTDMAGRTWRIAGGGAILGIRAPGQASDTISVTRGADGRVTSVTNQGVTTHYSRTVSGSIATMTVTDADNRQTVIETDLSVGRPRSVKDALGRTTSYQYDDSGRLTRVTAPEGNYNQYSYDARGNVTEVRAVAKPNLGIADIVTSATYAATCANPVTCNLPTSTTDARGNVTDYAYDATHGGVLSVTAPAPTSGAERPQVRYSYSLVNGEHLLTGVSACASGTAPGCVGTAAESRSVIGYDANGNVTSAEQRDGTGALSAVTTATYTAAGDVASVDGPLAGTADTTRFRYNAAREQVGAISADPDGAGPLPHRATRNIIDARGLVTRVDVGTVADTSDTAWANMAVHQSAETDHDAHLRPVAQRLTGGGAVHSLAQVSYDALGRVECQAQRMNPAAFGNLPPSACTLGTEGSFGPDRIVKTSYDPAGQVSLVQSALGVTGVQANEVSATYRPNGQVETLTDGENNRTTYVYDGHDRLKQTFYPVATKGANTSSTTDYEEYGYDPAGNVTSRRVRSGEVLNYSYDALNRLTLKDLPNTIVQQPDTSYGYDLLGRLVAASDTNGYQASYSYDALGRQLTEGSTWFGTRSSQYDEAGRRTRLTWHDGFFVTYDYNPLGEMTQVKESGATTLATYGYDGLGRRASLTRGNGAVTSYGYDGASRLSSLTQDAAGTAHDLNLTFGYNPAGQIVSNTRSNDAYSFTGAANQDAADTHNGLNQIVTTGGTGISHDARGNVTSDGGSRAISYSVENRMAFVNGMELGWHILGELGYLQASGTVIDYDQATGLAIAEKDASSRAVRRRYVPGASVDEPVVWYEGAGTTDRRYLHTDERGSVVAVSDGTGAVTNINRYDEYGTPASTNVGRFQYTGQMWLPEAGVYYYNSRMYDPKLRFMQPDPIGYGDGMNLYAYVGGDPVNFTDPSGLSRCAAGEVPVPIEPPPGSGDPDQSDGEIVVTGHYTCMRLVIGYGPYGINFLPLFDVGGGSGDQCRNGDRLALGGGVSGTLFGGIIGGSLGAGVQVSAPFSSLRNGSLRGIQFTFSGSGTLLGGVGLFGGSGPNLSGGLASTAPEGLQYTSGPVLQLGAGTGGGVEVSGNLGENAGIFNGSIGSRGALGLYGAIGYQFSANYSTPPIGC